MDTRTMEKDEALAKIALACALIQDVKDHYRDSIDQEVQEHTDHPIDGVNTQLQILHTLCEGTIELLKANNPVERLMTVLAVTEKHQRQMMNIKLRRLGPRQEAEDGREKM